MREPSNLHCKKTSIIAAMPERVDGMPVKVTFEPSISTGLHDHGREMVLVSITEEIGEPPTKTFAVGLTDLGYALHWCLAKLAQEGATA